MIGLFLILGNLAGKLPSPTRFCAYDTGTLSLGKKIKNFLFHMVRSVIRKMSSKKHYQDDGASDDTFTINPYEDQTNPYKSYADEIQENVSEESSSDKASLSEAGPKGFVTFLLLAQFFERLAYYTILSTLSVYCIRDLAFSTVEATGLVCFFGVWTQVVPVVNVVVVEKRAGHYHVLLRSYGLYILGLVTCASVVVLSRTVASSLSLRTTRIVFLAALYSGAGVGMGLHASTILPFIRHQFDEHNSSTGSYPSSDEIEQQAKYAKVAIWMVQLAAALAYGGLSYIGFFGFPPLLLSPQFGHTVVFCFALTCVMLSLFIFLAGHRRYVVKPLRSLTDESIVSTFWHTLADLGPRIRWIRSSAWIQLTAIICAATSLCFFIYDDEYSNELLNNSLSFQPAAGYFILATTASGVTVVGLVILTCVPPKASCRSVAHDSDFLAQDVVEAASAIPVYVLLIPFWIMHSQIYTSFIFQGCQMNFAMPSSTFQLAPTQFLTFVTVGQVLGSIVFEKAIFRCCRMSIRRRVGSGMTLGTVGMFLAGVFEIQRRNAKLLDPDPSTWGCGPNRPATDLTILFQVPQYACLGMSEIILSGAVNEFSALHVPPSMRKITFVLCQFARASGLGLAATLTISTAAFVPNDFNTGQVEYYFFGLGGLGLLTTLVILVLSRSIFVSAGGGSDGLPTERKSSEDLVVKTHEDDILTPKESFVEEDLSVPMTPLDDEGQFPLGELHTPLEGNGRYSDMSDMSGYRDFHDNRESYSDRSSSSSLVDSYQAVMALDF